MDSSGGLSLDKLFKKIINPSKHNNITSIDSSFLILILSPSSLLIYTLKYYHFTDGLKNKGKSQYKRKSVEIHSTLSFTCAITNKRKRGLF